MFPANKIRLSLGLLVTAGAILSLGPRLNSQAAPLDKIQRSVDLIRQILDKDGLYTRTTTSGTQYKSVTERKFTLKEAKGCQLIVTSDVHTHTDMPAQHRVVDRKWTDIYRPDFSSLDPASVFESEPQPPQPNWEAKGYLVRIPVEVGKALIPASTVNNETNEEHGLPGLPNLAVYVTTREQADRLAKPFTGVATACHA
jgi:hypothetical protein